MSESQFFESSARTAVRDAVVAVEAQTSAELVVTVRRQSDSYLLVDFAIGAAAAFVVLLLLLFMPTDFEVRWMPLEVLGTFFIGALMSRMLWSPKRWLTPNKELEAIT